MRKILSASLLLCLGLIPIASAADDKPLSKNEERRKFHPHRTGMEVAARSKAIAQREAMEKSSPLAALKFRNVGPEVQGGGSSRSSPRPRSPTRSSSPTRREASFGATTAAELDAPLRRPVRDDDRGVRPRRPGGKGDLGRDGRGELQPDVVRRDGSLQVGGRREELANTGLHDSHHIGKIVVDAKRPDIASSRRWGRLYTDRWRPRRSTGRRTAGSTGPGRSSSTSGPARSTSSRTRRAGRPLRRDLGAGPHGVELPRVGERKRHLEVDSTAGRPGSGSPGASRRATRSGGSASLLSPARPDRIYAVVDDQARSPRERSPDEEVPPGELTPRRLKALSTEQFAKLDAAAVQRFLARQRLPEEPLKAKALIRT